MTSRTVPVVNQLGMHARAAAKFVHIAARFHAQVAVDQQRPARWTGKASWACCCWPRPRHEHDDFAEGADEREAVEGLCALVRPASARAMQRLTGIGVSPGVVGGRAVILIQREQVLRYHMPPHASITSSNACRRAAAGPAAADGIRSGVAERRGPDIGVDVRCSAADAR